MKVFNKIILIAIPGVLFSFTPLKEMGCYDLWYARNSIFDENGYCFKSREAKIIFNPSCEENFKGLDKEAKDEVKRIIKIEKEKGCTDSIRFKKLVEPPIKVKDSKKYIVSGIKSDLSVRMQPNTNGKIIDFLINGVGDIKILGYSKNKKWAFIEFSNYTNYKLKGWVSKKYLKAEKSSHNKLSYKEKLYLLNKLDKGHYCKQQLEQGALHDYLYKNKFKDTFYEEYINADPYKCSKLKKNLFNCKVGIGRWANIYYGGEGGLSIDFIVKKEGNNLKIKKINRCMYAE